MLIAQNTIGTGASLFGEYGQTRLRGGPRKTWWDRLRGDMQSYIMSRELAQDTDDQ